MAVMAAVVLGCGLAALLALPGESGDDYRAVRETEDTGVVHLPRGGTNPDATEVPGAPGDTGVGGGTSATPTSTPAESESETTAPTTSVSAGTPSGRSDPPPVTSARPPSTPPRTTPPPSTPPPSTTTEPPCTLWPEWLLC